MHALNLGFGSLVNGNVLIRLLESGFFGHEGLPKETRLWLAWHDLKAYCHQQKIGCSQGPFTLNQAGWATAHSVPDLDCKAYNSRVITSWLQECWAASANEVPDPDRALVDVVIWGLASLYQRVEESPRYLSEAHASAIYRSGMASIQAYTVLNIRQMRKRPAQPRWILKPKIHKVHHLLRTVRNNRLPPTFGKTLPLLV